MLFPAGQRSRSPARVVITGAGIVTPFGLGWTRNAEGFRTGRIAIRPVSIFDASRQRVKVAGEVDIPSELPSTKLSARQEKRLDRATKLLLLAANEASTQSQWKHGPAFPIVLGTTSGGMGLGETYYKNAVTTPKSRRGQATRVMQYQAQVQALSLADAFGWEGPITIIANACASGANAIGHAWELVRRGACDRAITGGYDALSQLVFAGFDSLQALSPTRCRPFDAQRDGLALGEGAAILAIESLDHAQSRGAKILAEIAGYGAALDTHHLTQPHPEGSAAVAAMGTATRLAGIEPADIHYINAHGTGTPANDSSEASAINFWAGERAATLPVSSTKAGIGHLLGAAGAVETVVCLMALREQWLPPTTTLQKPDAACGFPVVQKPTPATLEYAMTNSFGFGGANASLVLRRWS